MVMRAEKTRITQFNVSEEKLYDKDIHVELISREAPTIGVSKYIHVQEKDNDHEWIKKCIQDFDSILEDADYTSRNCSQISPLCTIESYEKSGAIIPRYNDLNKFPKATFGYYYTNRPYIICNGSNTIYYVKVKEVGEDTGKIYSSLYTIIETTPYKVAVEYDHENETLEKYGTLSDHTRFKVYKTYMELPIDFNTDLYMDMIRADLGHYISDIHYRILYTLMMVNDDLAFDITTKDSYHSRYLDIDFERSNEEYKRSILSIYNFIDVCTDKINHYIVFDDIATSTGEILNVLIFDKSNPDHFRIMPDVIFRGVSKIYIQVNIMKLFKQYPNAICYKVVYEDRSETIIENLFKLHLPLYSPFDYNKYEKERDCWHSV